MKKNLFVKHSITPISFERSGFYRKREVRKFKQDHKFVYNWLGSIPFEQSLKAQEEQKSLTAQKSQFYFLGFSAKKPIITLGLRSDESHILVNEDQLRQYNLSKLKLKRGGEATLHAPGQLVIYPILSLPHLGLKVKDFIVKLEEITQSLLEDFGIKTKKEGKYAGLYTKRGKICFFGIHISGGVSQHGVSINVHNDLSLFNAIKSCGEQNRRHDSLSLYSNFSLSKEELFFKWCEKAVAFFNDKIDKKLTFSI